MLTATYLGSATPNGSTTANFSSYSQASGHTVVVMTETINNGNITSVTDTAGNLYTPYLAGNGYSVGGGLYIQMWYAVNCLGNASNIIRITYPIGQSFSTAGAYDLGGSTNIVPDVVQTNTGTSGSANSGAYTTTKADEVLIDFISVVSGALSASSVDSGYTLDESIQGNSTHLSAIAHNVVSSIQTAQTVTFTNTNTQWVSLFASFSGTVAPPANTQPVVIVVM
jgi:hypothetical protein